MTDTISIIQPDDWHLHLRDGDLLRSVVGESARHFARALVMPNLVPPVVSESDAVAYRQRISDALTSTGTTLDPLMTLYLTDNTEPQDVIRAAGNNIIRAVKLYPAGATTNSDSGVTSVEKVMPVLEAMAEHGIILCIHGEITRHEIDIFDREKVFIDEVLLPLRNRIPSLKIVLEHVTTASGVEFVQSQSSNTAATITPHHLLLNRNHMLVGGIRPHYYCLPVLKRETHQQALVAAATSGDDRFFLGTDSAPHTADTKENACGCAGVFNAPNTLSTLALVFENASALDRLEGFTSRHGPAFYDLPVNTDMITLVKRDVPIKQVESVQVGNRKVVVFDPGQPLYWHVQ